MPCYIIIGTLIRAIFDFIVVAIGKRVLAKLQPHIIGLVGGCGGVFAALFILFLIRKNITLTTNWYLIDNIAMITTITIIFYGQVEYFGINLKSVSSGITPSIGWPGRINMVASNPMERGCFAYYLDILQRRHPDFANGRALRQEAYKSMRQYMLSVSLGAMLGILAGIPLYYWLIYK